MQKPKQLYILPFDHRSTFRSNLFGWDEPINKAQVQKIKDTKQIIWQAFLKVHLKSSFKEYLGILVDEQFGSEILKKAKKMNIVTILTTEKSGQKVFDFEYGKDFDKHILKFKPDYAKVLVRYNPSNKKNNLMQLKRLKKINNFCQKKKIGLLFELLVPATDKQLEVYKDKFNYDKKARPNLTKRAIKEIRVFGIEPDIWKLEAMEKKSDWPMIIKEIKKDNKKDFKIIVLGRAAPKKVVKYWLKNAAGFEEIFGFAIGRTIFSPSLKKYRDKKINKKETIDLIAKNYQFFIKYWQKFKVFK
ncbi:MAG: DUF2090 domain-containing protein [Candidatus Buchananbacteria bacterium]|nr:DUF2090 domain-containing protein [Candidatus Buchananbacteria bacterium]